MVFFNFTVPTVPTQKPTVPTTVPTVPTQKATFWRFLTVCNLHSGLQLRSTLYLATDVHRGSPRWRTTN